VPPHDAERRQRAERLDASRPALAGLVDCLPAVRRTPRAGIRRGGSQQVLGSSRIPLEEMVKLDYLYVANWSVWGDLKLMLRTFAVVARRRGM
jgi:lipopolysaccharide/colanic/teichoic acid biosynthesis glycosyltransferase